MKIEAHIYMHESAEYEFIRKQLERIECLTRRIADAQDDRDAARELTGEVQASTEELKDVLAAGQTAP